MHMKNTFVAVLLAAIMACDNGKTTLAPPTSDLGTGINTVEHRYAKPVAEVLQSAASAVQALGLHCDSQKSDSLGGEIIARRATDDKVVITVKGVDQSTTSVSVRVSPGNRNMSNLIHEKIAAGLGLQETSSGSESATGLYSADMSACVGAAEKAFRLLKYEIVNHKNLDGGTEMRGRGEDSVPASFRFHKESDSRTEVTILCGITKGIATRERCGLLKAEFERALAGSRSP
jgi:hypothetical protein